MQRDELTLAWPGKDLSTPVMDARIELVEAIGRGTDELYPLIHGDNLASMQWLLNQGYEGRFHLIYLDPPYDSGLAWKSRIRTRGDDSGTVGERIAYRDVWAPGEYLQFCAERLLLLRQLLHPQGTIWVHTDHRRQAHLLLLLNEVFGERSFLNTITWRSQVARGAKVHARYFPRSAHFLHVFAREASSRPYWNPPRRKIQMSRTEVARRFMQDERGFFRTSDPGTYSFERLVELHKDGRLYAPFDGEIIVDESTQTVSGSNGGSIGIKYYVKKEGRNRFVVTRGVDNVWDDLPGLGTVPGEDVNYPTQKSQGLLRRIIECSTRPGELILDPFVGSGTTAQVAIETGRRWVGCDAGWQAIRTSANRVAPNLGPAESIHIFQATNAERCPPSGVAKVRLEPGSDRVRVVIDGFLLSDVADVSSDGRSDQDDWRRWVMSVAIDPDYDGFLFRAQIVDAPGSRSDVVCGQYLLDRPGKQVAVQVVDIAGGEWMGTLSTTMLPEASPGSKRGD